MSRRPVMSPAEIVRMLDSMSIGVNPGAKVLGIDLDAIGLATTTLARKRSKYRNVPTVYGGVRYDSKAEAERASELDCLARAREILWWLPKPGSFRLGCHFNIYRPDFLVVAAGSVWVEDVKGRETAKFRRDRKLWEEFGPCELHVLSKNGVEVIEGGNRRGQ